jgi:hypothetical protein
MVPPCPPACADFIADPLALAGTDKFTPAEYGL